MNGETTLETNKRETRFRLDKGVTLGEILTLVVLVFGIGSAWQDIRAHEQIQDDHLSRIDNSIAEQVSINKETQQSLELEKDLTVQQEIINTKSFQEVFDFDDEIRRLHNIKP